MGLDPEGYGNPDFCWLSIYDTLIWSFTGPVAFAVSVSARECLGVGWSKLSVTSGSPLGMAEASGRWDGSRLCPDIPPHTPSSPDR